MREPRHTRSFPRNLTAGALLLLAGLPAAAAAQATIAAIELDGSPIDAQLTGMGDVNGDGHADFLLAMPYHTVLGVVQLHSGADGSILREWAGTFSNSFFGLSVDAAGDVDGDGVFDVLVGEPGASPVQGLAKGHVYVFSSATGLLLHDMSGDLMDRLGTCVAGLGDLDADGRGDFAASAPNEMGQTLQAQPGYVKVYSGATGAELATIVGDVNGQHFGKSVRPAGDMNADGVPDMAVLYGGDSVTSVLGLRVYSGAWIAHGTAPALLVDLPAACYLGSVDRAGDINGDGFDDLVVGTPYDGTIAFTYPGGLYVISGKDQSLLLQVVDSISGQALGKHVAGAGDLNQDGVPDLLASGPGYDEPWLPGRAVALSGKDGTQIGSVVEVSPPWVGSFGSGLAGVGDVNADGTPDWGVTSPLALELSLYSQVGLWTDLGQGLAGANGIPTLSGAGLLLGGTLTTLQVESALPSVTLVLVVGVFPVNLPFKGGVLVPDAGWVMRGLMTDAAGGLTLRGTWPPNVPVHDFYLQVWQVDAAGPFGFAASNALRAQMP